MPSSIMTNVRGTHTLVKMQQHTGQHFPGPQSHAQQGHRMHAHSSGAPDTHYRKTDSNSIERLSNLVA